MSGFKTWNIGEVVEAGDFQTYIMNQTVMKFADAASRDAEIGAAVTEGMLCYLVSTEAIEYYDGAVWEPVSNPSDITAVTAGTALTGGGTVGDVTLDVDLSAITIPTSQISDITATAAELNILDGATVTAAELNILDGVTATTAELNILDGVTATTAELNILDGVTATTAELNILDGVTATASELNILDGATVTAAALNTIDDGTEGFTALSNGTAGISFQPVSHNYIINGAFDFWQRGTSGSGGFLADRWIFNSSGATITTSQQTFAPAELEIIGFGDAQFYGRILVDPDDPDDNTGFVQKVEDVRTLAGQDATISFYAEANKSLTINAQLNQVFGSGGSTRINKHDTLSITTSWARYSVTISLDSMSGKTIGGNSFLEVAIAVPAVDDFTLDIWGVQLEAGSVATPFKRHAPSLQGELAACQRYYYRTEKVNGGRYQVLYNFANNTLHGILATPTNMRSAPTNSFGNLEVRHSGSTIATITALTISNDLAGNQFHYNITVSGTPLTPGEASLLRATGGNGFIELIAEL